ncbi:AMP-binding protein [Haloechinothrix salitolerans]|uniref:AMP-binding protein n=1 Tax=Haloechinothrix salitolerans TaxID=926830 RepID=A0ABW2BVW1_9PSEU
MTTLAEIDDLSALVRRAARRWPDRTAWVFDETGTSLTFDDVARRSARLAGVLASHGITAGDRVAVMLRNRPEFPLLWLALARVGAAIVPINTNYREIDGGHVIAHSGARLAVVEPEFTDLLARIQPKTSVERVLTPDDIGSTSAASTTGASDVAAVPERPVNIQYTSGTTGAPKGCVLPHRYWLTLVRDLVFDFPSIGDSDTIITAQPFHYIDPQWNVALGLASGATLVVLDRFHPSTFWQKVREYDVTWFYCLGLMPTLLLRQPEHPDDRHHRVRAIHASAIPHDLHAALEQRWGVPWYEAFGMTETGADIRMSETDHDALVGSGCLGRSTRGREAVILGEDGLPLPRGELGELALRGTGLMLRYHDDPEATERAFRGGWFHTGDLATMDEQGRVYYVGRTKDMIRRSGENVSADEVERTLCQHPGVSLAAVIAVPDDVRGEEIKAFVVPSGDAEPKPDALAEFCSSKLAYFKVPRFWSVVDSLPMTPSERVAKGQLRGDDGDALARTYDRVERTWR